MRCWSTSTPARPCSPRTPTRRCRRRRRPRSSPPRSSLAPSPKAGSGSTTPRRSRRARRSEGDAESGGSSMFAAGRLASPRRRPAARSRRRLGQRRRDRSGRARRRLGRSLRRPDEPARPRAGDDPLAFRQRLGRRRSAPARHRARHGAPRRLRHPHLPAVLPLFRPKPNSPGTASVSRTATRCSR